MFKKAIHSLSSTTPRNYKPLNTFTNTPSLCTSTRSFLSTTSKTPQSTQSSQKITISTAKPFEYTFPLSQTALVMIDFQRDFLEEGGFGHSIVGDNMFPLRNSIPPAKKMLEIAREYNMCVVHTLEAHQPDLSDCHDSKRNRVPESIVGSEYKRIGDMGPMGRILVRGEYGNDIIDELAPVDGELSLYKPGKGAFYNTELDEYLSGTSERNITHLLFAGVTTDVCVQTSMREANDRGYNCLLLEDATESFYPGFREVVCQMVVLQDCVVGWTAKVDEVIESIRTQAKTK